MLTDFSFYEPHQYARRRTSAPSQVSHLLSDPKGRFTFNLPAVELLELKPHRSHVALGQNRHDANEWMLMQVQTGGFEVKPMGGPTGTSTSYRTMGFTCLPLRRQLVAGLHADWQARSLTLKLDKFSCPAEDGEAWLLLTAPYYQAYQPPKPAGERPSRALLMTAPPGLIGLLRQVDVPNF